MILSLHFPKNVILFLIIFICLAGVFPTTSSAACGPLFWNQEDVPDYADPFTIYIDNDINVNNNTALQYADYGTEHGGSLAHGGWQRVGVGIVYYRDATEASRTFNRTIKMRDNDQRFQRQDLAPDTVMFQGTWPSSVATGVEGMAVIYALVHDNIIIKVGSHLAATTNVPDITPSLKSYLADALELVNSKCCENRIPLPTGGRIFYYDQDETGLWGGNIQGEKPGLVPASSSPIYLQWTSSGNQAEQAKTDSYTIRISFCPFEKPVDIYVAYMMPAMIPSLFYLGPDGKAAPAPFSNLLTTIKPWRANSADAVNTAISGTFGGLFRSADHPPLGNSKFIVMVTPAGQLSSGELSDAYLWILNFNFNCNYGKTARIPTPTARNYYIYRPEAVASGGENPAEMRPLAFGPTAAGGSEILMYYQTCGLEDGSEFDLHFAVYTPELDPENLYFLHYDLSRLGIDLENPGNQQLQNLDPGQISQILWDKVPVTDPEHLILPATPYDESCLVEYDDLDTELNMLGGYLNRKGFIGFMGIAEGPYEFDPLHTYFMLAVARHGVRDKFHAWISDLNWNFRQAMEQSLAAAIRKKGNGQPINTFTGERHEHN